MNADCEHCRKPYRRTRPWQRFCSAICRRGHFQQIYDKGVIHRYLSERAKKAWQTRRRRLAQ